MPTRSVQGRSNDTLPLLPCWLAWENTGVVGSWASRVAGARTQTGSWKAAPMRGDETELAAAHEAALKDLSAPAAQRPRTESGHILCDEPSGCSVCREAFPTHVAAWNADYDAVQAAKTMQADWDAAIEEGATIPPRRLAA